MPSILSKILMPEWNVPYNCYELGHTWTPFCTEAALEMGLIVFNQSLRLYAPLYLGNQLLQKKFDVESFKKTIRSILRSSIFLGINAFLVILFFCLSRQMLGRFYYTLCAYIPSFFGSFLAILNEQPSRRRALAFYVANIASETLFRILVSRGYIREVPNGQFYMFATAISLLMFLYETDLLQDPLIKFVFQLLIGKTNEIYEKTHSQEKVSKDKLWNQFHSNVHQMWMEMKNRFPILDIRHRACFHSARNSCFEQIVFQSFMKSFALGWFSHLALKSLPKLMAGRFKDGLKVFTVEQMFSSRNISFSLMLSSFTTIYNSSRCILSHTTNGRNHWHSILSSILASPAIFLAPSSSMTLYLVWKCVEAYFNVGIKKGLVPYDKFLVHLLYAVACSQLFYAAILDPSHMKPSYKRFIDRVTENRLKFINRNVLEVFGTNASKGYESFLPVYDLKHTTKSFQESVLVWLL